MFTGLLPLLNCHARRSWIWKELELSVASGILDQRGVVSLKEDALLPVIAVLYLLAGIRWMESVSGKKNLYGLCEGAPFLLELLHDNSYQTAVKVNHKKRREWKTSLFIN